MAETMQLDPPFDDDGNGYPTPESVREALALFKMDNLAGVPVSFRGEEGTVQELISRCRIEHLTQNWPKGFIGQVVGIVSQQAERKG